MSLLENLSIIEEKNHGMGITKTENSEHFITPKISTSVSFNNLAKVKIRTRTKSPLTHDKDKSQDYSGSMNPASHQITNKYKQTTNAPKVSKKLPPAFGTIFQKSSAKLVAKKPSFDYSKDNTEPLQAIEQLVGIQEYKNTMGLLSPLKPKKVKSQQDDPQRLLNKKTDNKRQKNPLLPLKNYLLLSKINEEKREVSNLSVERLERLYKVPKDVLITTKKEILLPKDLKPNEMITLSVIRSSHETGTVKKLLHAPTLRLFAVKEVPLSTRETRINLKEWLSQWQNNFEHSKSHIKVYATSFNSPEGCLSIFMELMSGGSLHNLLESIGNLPETIIRYFASQILLALDNIHQMTHTVYGALSPSQILIDKEGNIKLSLGLSNKIQGVNIGNFGTMNRNNYDKTALYELTPINNPSSYQKQLLGTKDTNGLLENRNLMFSQDIFEFGYLMLICATGGLNFYEPNEFADKLKLFLEELGKKPHERQKYCCIIHNEDLINSIKNPEETLFTNKPVRVQKGTGIIIDKGSKPASQITIQDFLVNNFSKEFVNFLCGCLKFDPQERKTIKSLLHSPFLKSQSISKGPVISLPELLKISVQWNKSLILPTEYQGPSEKQLKKVCEALAVVLPNCESVIRGNKDRKPFEALRELNANSQVIQNLAFELGLPPVKVWENIKGMLNGLIDG